ncbi:DJ-1/PfpI family protein [Gluconacetobacter sp. 1b LMG 1731]|uniref:DJ-1/PfpI family protein n=1 Tax=Gluconacetobacter dulcium TaxID=2729096 RepID=A0A7W4INU0_9PROT|nr:DJ-1/PfpI family protein [Gluconacetobacter dulcium]MBB2166315.1 DJ-1/PfpI family protein [Gluconacetobacter dulcium]MBB2195425.1 DJ-1/PfpI family protein [Gluconacetobacter dulcium]
MTKPNSSLESGSCVVFAQIKPSYKETIMPNLLPDASSLPGLKRRALATLIMASIVSESAKAATGSSEKEHLEHMQGMKFSGPPIKIAMLVYPNMVLQDLVGPQTIFKILGAEIHLVGMTMTPVSTDVGIPVPPTDTPATCPQELDVLFVPGGLMGTIACMNDPDVLAFLISRAPHSRFITSVCTGSLILAAAGLLEGYKATSHWGVVNLLPLMGAIESHERVVQDRNRITGGGVTAGLDFGLTLAAQLRGQAAAEHIQLIIQYAPQPPFHHGDPSEIPEAQMALERSRRAWMDGKALQAAQTASKRLKL